MSAALHSSPATRLSTRFEHGPRVQCGGGSTPYWTPDRLTDLAATIKKHGFDKGIEVAAKRYGKKPETVRAACHKFEISRSGVYNRPPEEPSRARETTCIGPMGPHRFLSPDPRYQRICDDCRKLDVFRAFR